MIRAARLLIEVGGMDLAGSLAYFTILSLLPAVALFIMAMAVVGDPEDVRGLLTEVLVYYFPTSRGLIQGAVDNLLQGSPGHRTGGVRQSGHGGQWAVHGCEQVVEQGFRGRGPESGPQDDPASDGLDGPRGVFLLSIGLSASLQLAVRYSEGIAESTGGFSAVVVLTLSAVSTLLPAFFTMVVFAFVYFRMPNVRVQWRDAVFGAITAIVLFEAGKHLFFWFTTVASQRNAVYGPIASFVVLPDVGVCRRHDLPLRRSPDQGRE